MRAMRNRKGSSSVLVILTFLLLMVFAVLAMASSFADFRLASKNAKWTSDYYQLEGEAQEFTMKLDEIAQELRNQDLIQVMSRIDSEFPGVITEEFPGGVRVTRILDNGAGLRMMTEHELYELDRQNFSVRTMKVVPEEFQYEDTIMFEDMEVIEE
jgi:hypothetical protein